MLKDFKIFTYCTDTNNEIFKKLTSQLDIEVLPILTKRWCNFNRR